MIEQFFTLKIFTFKFFRDTGTLRFKKKLRVNAVGNYNKINMKL